MTNVVEICDFRQNSAPIDIRVAIFVRRRIPSLRLRCRPEYLVGSSIRRLRLYMPVEWIRGIIPPPIVGNRRYSDKIYRILDNSRSIIRAELSKFAIS